MTGRTVAHPEGGPFTTGPAAETCDLAAERDPSKRMIALVEPATNMLIRATRFDEVNEIRSQAEALERYVRTIRLSREAIGAAQTIARRRRGPHRPARPETQRRAPNKRIVARKRRLSSDQRHDFRTMADNYPTVEEVLGELAPEGQATRSGFCKGSNGSDLRRRRGAAKDLDQTPIHLLMDAKQAMRLAIRGVERMQGYGQTPSSPALARDVKELCRQLGEML